MEGANESTSAVATQATRRLYFRPAEVRKLASYRPHMKTISGKAKTFDLGEARNSIVEYFNAIHEKDLNDGRANPFIEPRKRGRKSLETLMRKDFAQLWNEDCDPRRRVVGFLSALLNPKNYKNPFPTSKAGTLHFIQRGH